jgi:serine carboxypeptidase-like clade I
VLSGVITNIQVSNIIFVDSPVGTGFSYSRTEEAYQTSDSQTVHQLLTFLYKVISNFEIQRLSPNILLGSIPSASGFTLGTFVGNLIGP